MSERMARILVVGAGGFVGRRLVEALHARGETVIAGVRRRRDGFDRLGIEQRLFDASDAAAVSAALQGVTHVVDAVMGSPAAMSAATRALIEAARAVGARRYVYFSSIAVFGDAEGAIGDDHPQGGNVDAYGQAKIDGELIVREAGATGLEAVILRPALIYGPGSEQWTARIGRLLVAHRLGDLGPAGDGICNLVHVDDVVGAAVAALSVPEAAGGAFNLALPEAPTWNRYLMDFARALGAVPVSRIPARQLRLETKLVAIPLKIAEILCARLGLGSFGLGRLAPDPVTPGLGRLFSLEARYHSPAADRILGPQQVTYGAGLAQAAAWFGDLVKRR